MVHSITPPGLRARCAPQPFLDEHCSWWCGPAPNTSPIALPQDCVRELTKALTDGVRRDAFEHCRAFAQGVRTILFAQSGVAFIEGLPVVDNDVEKTSELYRAFSALFAPLMQRARAVHQPIDELVDEGRTDVGWTYRGAKRSSQPNAVRQFHTHGSWLGAPPKVVGVSGVVAAGEGITLRVTSIAQLHEHLVSNARHACLSALSRPVYWDKDGEHAQSDAPFARHPVFDVGANDLVARYCPSRIRRGYAVAGVTMDDGVAQALHDVKQALEAQPQVFLSVRPGTLLFINNWWLAHACTVFDSAVQTRQLLCTWHTDA